MMSKRHRKILLRRFHHLYRPYPLYTTSVCVYCCGPANTLDHVPPLSVTAMRAESGARLGDCWLYPSCADCNKRLNSFQSTNIAVRRGYVAAKLLSKHSRTLNMPEWSDEELAELGCSLKSYIQNESVRKRAIEDRIYNLVSRD